MCTPLGLCSAHRLTAFAPISLPSYHYHVGLCSATAAFPPLFLCPLQAAAKAVFAHVGSLQRKSFHGWHMTAHTQRSRQHVAARAIFRCAWGQNFGVTSGCNALSWVERIEAICQHEPPVYVLAKTGNKSLSYEQKSLSPSTPKVLPPPPARSMGAFKLGRAWYWWAALAPYLAHMRRAMAELKQKVGGQGGVLRTEQVTARGHWTATEARSRGWD